MKAIVYKKYGSPDVLELEDIKKPTPQDNEVLVKVRASSVNPAEYYAMTGFLPVRLGDGFFKPKDIRLGVDYSGVVEAVGKDRSDFKVGDEVYGARSGAFAEYVCVQKIIIPKPKNISFEQAASIPVAGMTALQALRTHGNIQAAQKVLINGASGGVGTFTVQIAKAFGTEVTGVCSTKNLELVHSLGADHVIDYTKENFTRNNKNYDLIIDIGGGHSWFDYKRVLKPEGNFVLVGARSSTGTLGPLSHVIKILLATIGAKQRAKFFVAKFVKEDFLFLNELMEAGKLKPYVEKTYSLDKISQAMEYLGTNHVKGKLVVTM